MKVIAYIRSFIAIIFVVLFYTVFSLIMLPILWLIGKINLLAREKTARAISNTCLRFVAFVVGVKTKVSGLENIPDKPCLIVSNHRSFFDVITAYPTMKDYRLGFVGKKEFGKVYTFKIWMLYCGCIFLDRDNPREGLRTINETAELIKGGRYMWIYPEGTRNHGQELLEFKEGSFRIAEKAGCPIVPAAHVHTDDAFELHMPYVTPTTVGLHFGKPLETAGLKRAELKEVYAKCILEIDRLYKENY